MSRDGTYCTNTDCLRYLPPNTECPCGEVQGVGGGISVEGLLFWVPLLLLAGALACATPSPCATTADPTMCEVSRE